MQCLGIGLDLLVVLVAAIVGGVLARWLRLPVILGYLAGGVAVGPYGIGNIALFGGSGFVHEIESIHSLAEIGVILLLFAIGLEFSLKDLLKLGKISLVGGIVQMLLSAAALFWVARYVGFGMTGAVFFGFIIAMSSTMVALKILIDRGELDSIHGRIMLGVLLVEDLGSVPILVAIEAVAGDSGSLLTSLGIAFAKAAGCIGLMFVLGLWVMPWILKKVAGQRSQELFLLTVILICLGSAFGTYYFGLSAAFGAFAAGLLISQSGYARQAFADILPLRDTFSALFFVSLGMLADIHFVADNLQMVAIVVAAIIVTKFIIYSLITRLFGYSHKTALMVGTGLAQAGEFSFILATEGVQTGIISDSLFSLIIAAAIISLLTTPFTMSFNSFLYRWLSQKKWFARYLTAGNERDWRSGAPELARHAVICGYGGVGGRLASVLDRQKLPYLVIDLDPTVISGLRARGVPCIYGDASNPEILSHADLDKARVLVCTIPDYRAEEMVARNARKINPKLDIVARVHRDADGELLRGIGVTELVLPFFEGSLEMVRHTLHRFGMSGTDIQYILNQLRQGQTEGKKE